MRELFFAKRFHRIIEFIYDEACHYQLSKATHLHLTDTSSMLIRQDPPFTMTYITTLSLMLNANDFVRRS